ncbi:MAG: hypothetical protein IJ079_03775 [Lachnospiraceae bacterium]|nr:hypothetical protein [Lachnospiraceae bacterium]
MHKKGKNPTRVQKVYIRDAGLNVENWLVCRQDDRYLYLIHRISGNEKQILKKGR